MDEKIKILVTDEKPNIKSSLPFPGMEEISQRVVEIGRDAIAKNLEKAIGNVLDLLSSIRTENESHQVSETKFSLIFDATGEVSIVSLAKGSVKGSSGLEFTIKSK